jgi:hypothetical protein
MNTVSLSVKEEQHAGHFRIQRHQGLNHPFRNLYDWWRAGERLNVTCSLSFEHQEYRVQKIFSLLGSTTSFIKGLCDDHPVYSSVCGSHGHRP